MAAVRVTDVCAVGWNHGRLTAWLKATLPADAARNWSLIVAENSINGSALLALSKERLDELVEAYYIQQKEVNLVLSNARLLKPVQWSAVDVVAWVGKLVPAGERDQWRAAVGAGGGMTGIQVLSSWGELAARAAAQGLAPAQIAAVGALFDRLKPVLWSVEDASDWLQEVLGRSDVWREMCRKELVDGLTLMSLSPARLQSLAADYNLTANDQDLVLRSVNLLKLFHLPPVVFAPAPPPSPSPSPSLSPYVSFSAPSQTAPPPSVAGYQIPRNTQPSKPNAPVYYSMTTLSPLQKAPLYEPVPASVRPPPVPGYQVPRGVQAAPSDAPVFYETVLDPLPSPAPPKIDRASKPLSAQPEAKPLQRNVLYEPAVYADVRVHHAVSPSRFPNGYAHLDPSHSYKAPSREPVYDRLHALRQHPDVQRAVDARMQLLQSPGTLAASGATTKGAAAVLTRAEAEKILAKGANDGDFVIRTSESRTDMLVLSVRVRSSSQHFSISIPVAATGAEPSPQLYVMGQVAFASLDELVLQHRREAGPLPVCLRACLRHATNGHPFTDPSPGVTKSASVRLTAPPEPAPRRSPATGSAVQSEPVPDELSFEVASDELVAALLAHGDWQVDELPFAPPPPPTDPESTQLYDFFRAVEGRARN